MNLENIPQLPRIVPVRNSVCFSKSIFKVVSASSVLPSKPIFDSNVPPSKTVSASNVSLSKPADTIIFHPSKPIIGGNIRSSKSVALVLFV